MPEGTTSVWLVEAVRGAGGVHSIIQGGRLRRRLTPALGPMPKLLAGQPNALPLLALLGAATVGAWLGFSSCGGYVWQDYFGYGVLALAVLSVAVRPSSLVTRVGLAALVIAAFVVARGIGFAAYVGASGPGDYLRQVGSTFSSGLC